MALVAANLVPLVGAVFLGWNVGAIVVLYWFECVIVGVLNVPKMALANGGRATSGASAVVGVFLYKVVAIPFFALQYSAFLFVSGVAALYLAVASGGSEPPTNFSPGAYFALIKLPIAGLIVAAISLLLSHLVSFNDFLVRRDYEGIDPISQMGAAYPRVFMLLVTALASGAVIVVMGSPVWAVATFVIGKTLLDLRLGRSTRKEPLS